MLVDRFQEIALALLCLAPLAIIPGGENRFVFGKLAVFAAGVAVACFAVPRGRLPASVSWLLVGGLALTALSAGIGANPLNAIVGAAPRYEGLPTLALYAACGWAGARLIGPLTSGRAVRTLIWSLSTTAVVVGFVAVLETAGLRPLSSNLSRPGSLLGNASDEGALGVLIAGTLGWIVLRRGMPPNGDAGRRDYEIALIGTGAASTVVALSASRAALVGLAVVAVTLVLVSPARRRAGLLGAVVAVAVVTLVAPGSRGRVTGSSPLATATVHGRLLLWQETLGLIVHHPALGIGPGTFVNEITPEHDLRWEQQVGPANPPDSPHDWILQVTAVGGVALLAVVAAVCLLSARKGLGLLKSARAQRAVATPDDERGTGVDVRIGAFAGLAGYGVALLFGFSTPATTPLAAVLGGALLAQSPLAASSPRGTWPSLQARRYWLVAPAAVALLVIAIMGSAAEIQLRRALDTVAAGNVDAADSYFKAASALRAWDPSVDETAAHAFVVIAQTNIASAKSAARAAGYWVKRAAQRLPGDEQVQLDEASLAELRSNYTQAATLLERVLEHDRHNPAVLLRLGVVQGESGALTQAAATLVEVTHIDPTSPDPWDDLAIVYRLEGHPALAVQATARAQHLRG